MGPISAQNAVQALGSLNCAYCRSRKPCFRCNASICTDVACANMKLAGSPRPGHTVVSTLTLPSNSHRPFHAFGCSLLGCGSERRAELFGHLIISLRTRCFCEVDSHSEPYSGDNLAKWRC